MDSRGYGRRAPVGVRQQRLAQVATLLGAIAATIGVYGILDGAAPGGVGYPMLAAGAVLLVASFSYAGSQSVRTRYRPDPWRAPEWVVVVSGAVALIALVAAAKMGVDGLRPQFSPLTVPTVPLLPTLGILVAALPALVTPQLPVTR
jgi:energy-coupling factor transport system permease protein